MIEFSEKGSNLFFAVRAVPHAAKNAIIGEHNGALKVRLAAPPVNGAANAELIQVLAKFFAVSKSAIEIVSGETAKIKQIKIIGATAKSITRLTNQKLS